MPAPNLHHVGTINGTTTWKMTDITLEGGTATVVDFMDFALSSRRVHCLACDKYDCLHAKRVQLRNAEGR